MRCSYNKSSLHTHTVWSHCHVHNIVAVPSSCDLYSCDLFLLTLTLTVSLLERFRRWRESAHHIPSFVVVLRGRQDPRGFRAWRSRIKEHVGASCSQWWWCKRVCASCHMESPFSRAVISNHSRPELLCKNRNCDFDSKYKYICAAVTL